MTASQGARWASRQPPDPTNWHKSALTPAQWDELLARRRDGEPVRALAVEYGVTASSIRQRT